MTTLAYRNGRYISRRHLLKHLQTASTVIYFNYKYYKSTIYYLEGDTFNTKLSLACALIPAFLDAGAKTLKWATTAGQKLVNSTSYTKVAFQVTDGTNTPKQEITNTVKSKI